MGTLSQTKERNYLWDNLKAFLITLVVVAHFLGTFPVNDLIFDGINYWINTFHMPAFLFISGFLSKSYCNDGKVFSEKNIRFIAYYLVFQVIFFIYLKLLFSPEKQFTLFTPNIGLWYLVSLISYYLMIPLMEKLPSYMGFSIVIFLSLLIGTEKNADTFMAISRTFSLAPFFFAGYYTPEKLINLIRNFKGRYFVGTALIFISAATCVFFIVTTGLEQFPIDLFQGANNYYKMGFEPVKGILFKTIAMTLSFLSVAGLLMVFPGKRNIFSYMGQNSLQIYIFHFSLIIFFKLTPFTQQFPINELWQGILLCLAGVVFTLILSIPPLSKPFQWINRGVNKILSLPKYNFSTRR